MKIGLVGGSFNPPHQGHIYLSELAIKKLALSQIWWVATAQNPFKEIADWPYETRLEQCLEITKNYPKISQQRYKSLTKLTNKIQESNQVQNQNIYSSSPDISGMAWQQTLKQVFDKIDQYNPNKETVSQWFLSLFKLQYRKLEKECL